MGVNANTQRPDDAFWIVDYLMSQEGQTGKLFAFATHTMAVPTMEGLMADPESAISDGLDGKAYMNENMYKALCQLRDGISAADFITPLEQELSNLYNGVMDGEASKPAESLVHDAYTHMRMDLGES